MPTHFDCVVFDLDGVVTQTSKVCKIFCTADFLLIAFINAVSMSQEGFLPAPPPLPPSHWSHGLIQILQVQPYIEKQD